MCTLIWYLGVMGTFCYIYFLNTHLYCIVRCLSMIVWTHAVLDVLYACVLYFCVRTFHRNWACFTWKGVLEIRLLLLLLLLLLL